MQENSPILYGDRRVQLAPKFVHIRRIFCAAAISADYALLSPCVRRYGYGASQRRVCDGSFACYLLWEPTW
jgi:hypothetical protein